MAVGFIIQSGRCNYLEVEVKGHVVVPDLHHLITGSQQVPPVPADRECCTLSTVDVRDLHRQT